MRFFLNYFNKQNWGIRIGYVALVVSIVFLLLGLTLIATAKFTPKDANQVNANLVGNGFDIMANHGLPFIYSNYEKLYGLYFVINKDNFISAPLIQLVFGTVFLVIFLPIAAGISILGLIGGYFKRWLYT